MSTTFKRTFHLTCALPSHGIIIISLKLSVQPSIASPPPLKGFLFSFFSLFFFFDDKKRKSKRRKEKNLSFSHATDSILSKSVRDAHRKELKEGALLLPIESVFYHLMAVCGCRDDCDSTQHYHHRQCRSIITI